VARGLEADGGICAEHSGFDAWITTRGTLWPYVIVPGRAGHAEMPHPHWQEGGAVNAIDKAQIVLDAARRLREEWRTRRDRQHPLLATPTVIATMIEGGIFPLTYPPSCKITFDVTYLPSQVDAGGTGEAVEREVREFIDAAAAADPWLAANPLKWGLLGDTVAAEMAADHPLVDIVLEAGAALGHPGQVGGLDSWHDAAYYTARAHTPTFSYGPKGLETAHAPDERVPVNELVDYSAIVAIAISRYCSSANDS
jgi:acetylornithine deacetylase